jgi:membrane-bound lytic murein transglycosylase D
MAALAATLLCASSSAAYEYTRVPRLEPNVAFWQKVYVTWSVDDIALHDTEDFKLVYRVVRVPARGQKENGLTRAQAITQASTETREALRRLDNMRPMSADGLNDVEKEIFERLKNVARADKYAFSTRVRAQNGLRERFLQGYRAAGAWEPEVRERLKEAGLPEDLVALAYVESLMTIRAKSHAGAVGIWQFMPATGREYMHVNSVVDERMDPILATDAAAKYINTALKNVGPWPVAITSYNYGRGGMKRAITETGSTDLAVILERYKHKNFGFAARNYYASFLAVHDVLHNPERFLGKIEQKPAWRYEIVRLPFPVLSNQLASTGVDKDTLIYMNPGLTEAARSGQEALPRGLPLRVPTGKGETFVRQVLALSQTERAKADRLARVTHKANGKETPAHIAKTYGVSVDVVAKAAGVGEGVKVKKGTLLALPSTKQRYSLFPNAKSLGIPDAPHLDEGVRLAALTSTDAQPAKPDVVRAERVALIPVARQAPHVRADKVSKGHVKAKVIARVNIKDDVIEPVDVLTSAHAFDLPAIDVLAGGILEVLHDGERAVESEPGVAFDGVPTS